MEKGKSKFSELAKAGAAMPKERMMMVGAGFQKLFIGIPKESAAQEHRVPLVPSAVALLTYRGHEVVIESGAGQASSFTDTQYSEAGAQVVYSPQEVYKADIILKIGPPTKEEVALIKERQTLFSILSINMQGEDYLRKLSEKKITAIGYEFLRDKTGILSVIKAMSEIVGSSVILIAAEYLSNQMGGRGEMLGGVPGIPPTEVVIIGAGTVGEFAARTALGLGASVKVFDHSAYKLRRLQNTLGQQVYTSIISPPILADALTRADVAVGALKPSGMRSPMVVSEEMVTRMKPGAVIADVSIDMGGCFETSRITTHNKPVFTKHDIIHYCVPNIASRVSRTASMALSNIFSQILATIGDSGGIEGMLLFDKGVRDGVYLYRGTVTNAQVGQITGIPPRDLNLLLAARF